MLKARWAAREQSRPTRRCPASTRVLAIASGKGGVGKSSVTVNLAAAIAAAGYTVGVLDADIWGFSVPRMLGLDERLEAQVVEGSDRPLIIPNERAVGRGRLKVVSTGLLVDDEGTALMWRGLMLTKAVEQFLRDVHWGAARLPAHRHAARHRRRPDGPRPHAAPHRPDHRHDAGGQRPEGGDPGRRHGPPLVPAGRRRDREHEQLHLRPRRPSTRCSGPAAVGRWPTRSAPSCSGRCRSSRPSPPAATAGQPVALDGTGPAAEAFRAIAHTIVTETVPPVAMAGCSARLLDAVEAALGPAATH